MVNELTFSVKLQYMTLYYNMFSHLHRFIFSADLSNVSFSMLHKFLVALLLHNKEYNKLQYNIKYVLI